MQRHQPKLRRQQSADSDTLHYFRKLLKECRVDQDYRSFQLEGSSASERASPLRPHGHGVTGRMLDHLWSWWPGDSGNWGSAGGYGIPPVVEMDRANRLPWSISVSPDGRRVALAKRLQLELYSAKKGLNEPLATMALPDDAYCQWRLMCWSADSQYLAIGGSDGSVVIATVRGQKLCELNCEQVTDNQHGCPLAFVMLESGSGNSAGALVLLTVTLTGMLKQFLLDLQQSSQTQQPPLMELPAQCLSAYSVRDRVAGQPVFCGCYDPVSGTLALGTVTMRHSPTLSAPLQNGLQLWRRTSEFPFVKPSLALEEDVCELGRSRRFLTSVLLRHPRGRPDCVIALALSPDCGKLAAAHAYGCVSVWTFPAGNLVATFALPDQCLSSVRSPHLMKNRILGVARRLYHGRPDERPSGVEWWSESVLIVARTNGSVSLLDAATCQSIMGSSPEWFEPYPAVTPPRAGQFLILECEVRKRRAKQKGDATRTDANAASSFDDFADDSDAEADTDTCSDAAPNPGVVAGLGRTAYRSAQRLLWATGSGLKRLFAIDGDADGYGGPSSSKRGRYVASRDYRIVCFKRTSPEELFHWKLDSDEYGEALLLARNYGLDSDLVYQRQWQKSQMTQGAIDDFLVRITKRHWVLHECLHQVPRNLDSARDLLEFGLRATDVDCLVAIGAGEDKGELVLTDPNVYAEMNFTGERLTMYEEAERVKKNEQEYRLNKLATIDWNRLKPEQRELMRARRQLLAHLHRLDCYEQVLGGRHRAPERYSPEEFTKFRSRTPIGLAVGYARDGNYDAVDHVISHYPDELLPSHWLLLLANTAECDSPRLYEFLFPTAGRRLGDPDLLDWPRRVPPREDWTWRSVAVEAVPPAPLSDEALAEIEGLYAEASAATPSLPRPPLSSCPAAVGSVVCSLTSAQVSAWLAERARFIEASSLLVDNALSLLELGVERGFTGLEDLLEEVQLLANIVYASTTSTDFRLANLSDLTELERCHLLVSRRDTREDFLSDAESRLAPHLIRLESRRRTLGRDLLRRLLVDLAAEARLPLVAAYVERAPPSAAVRLADQSTLVQFALDAVNACTDADTAQLDAAARIAELAGQHSVLAEPAQLLRFRIDACRIVGRRGAPRTPAQLAALDAAGADLLLQQAARHEVRAWCSEAAATKDIDQRVSSLLRDLESLATGSLAALVPVGRPLRLLLQCLLTAGQSGFIRAAVGHLELEPGRLPSKRPYVPYQDSVQLIVAAAADYFNSAASASDPTVELAGQCLGLLTKRAAEVQRELDLIEALILVESLGVPVLPVGLRTHPDPCGMLAKAARKQPGLYNQLDKLLRVCQLLRLTDTSAVQLAAGEAALDNGDAKFCSRLCHRLIAENPVRCPEVWRLCYALLNRWPGAPSGRPADRLRMAKFCTVYCSPDMLEAVCDLLEDVECSLGDASDKDNDSSTDDTVNAAIDADQAERAEIVNKGAGGFLAKYGLRTVLRSAATSKRLLDSTLARLGVDLALAAKSSATGLSSSKTRSTTFPIAQTAFYDTDLNSSDNNEDIFSLLQAEVDADSEGLVRRVHLLARRLWRYPNGEIDEEDLRQLDSLFAELALSRCEVSTLEAFAATVAVSQSALELPLTTLANRYRTGPTLHAFALVTLAYHATLEQRHHLQHHLLLPGRIYALGKARLASSNAANALPSCLVEEFRRNERLLSDWDLAGRLSATCPTVNLERFQDDSAYRVDTVLGLAMTTDEGQLRLARALAARYDIADWDVCAANLEHLFTDLVGSHTISLDQLRTAVEPLLSALRSRPDDFRQRLLEVIYPMLDGRDLPRILYFFGLVEPADTPLTNSAGGRTAEWHRRTLRKLQTATASSTATLLDYRRLVSGECADPLGEVLAPALTEQNVGILAKLAPSFLVGSSGEGVRSGAVYGCWVTRLFWGDVTAASGEAVSGSDRNWIRRYEACLAHVPRLDPVDYMSFIRSVAFGTRAIQVPVEARLEILRRGAKFCKQQLQLKKKQSASAAASLDASTQNEPGWTTASDAVSAWLKHTQHLRDQLLPRLHESGASPEHIVAAEALGPELGDSERLVSRLLAEDAPLDTVVAIAEFAELTADNLAHWLRSGVAARIRVSAEDADWIVAVSGLLEELRDSQRTLPAGLDDTPVLDALKDCLGGISAEATALTAERRASVLDFLADYFELSGERLLPLLAGHAAECIARLLPSVAMDNISVLAARLLESEAARCAEFVRLAGECNSVEQVSGISDLLALWPQPFQAQNSATTSSDDTGGRGGNSLEPAWLAWLDACRRLGLPGRCLAVSRARSQQPQQQQQPALPLWTEAVHTRAYEICLADSDWNAACHLARLSPQPADTLANFLAVYDRDPSAPELQPDALLALVDSGLAGCLPASRRIYSQFIAHLLADRKPDAADRVARTVDQLRSAGCLPEASWLLMEHRGGGCHPGLRTWHNAAALLRML